MKSLAIHSILSRHNANADVCFPNKEDIALCFTKEGGPIYIIPSPDPKEIKDNNHKPLTIDFLKELLSMAINCSINPTDQIYFINAKTGKPITFNSFSVGNKITIAFNVEEENDS